MPFRFGSVLALLVVTVISPTFGALHPGEKDELVVSEWHERDQSKVFSREICIQRGGYIDNVNRGADGQHGAVKLMLNASKIPIAINYGAPFNFPADNGAAGNANSITGDRFYVASTTPEFVQTAMPSTSVCQRIIHYKCLNDIIFNSTEHLRKALDYNCKEIHGDLIIKMLGFEHHDTPIPPARFNITFFKRIERIRGKIIIEGVASGVVFNFSKLTHLGQNLEDTVEPRLKVKDNLIKAMSFPVLNEIYCSKEIQKKKKCGFFENNWKYLGDHPLKIHFGNKSVADALGYEDETQIKYRGRLMTLEEKNKYKTEKEMRAVGLPLALLKYHDEPWTWEFIICYTFSAVVPIGLILVIPFNILKKYRKNEVHMKKEMQDMRGEDEKSIKETDSAYFKVAETPNNNNNDLKNSAMDDLGSIG